MSFGVSVGDFVAVGKLIKEISSCLQDAGGAESDYQELLRELECLQQALQHLDRLHGCTLSRNLNSIKYAALSCQRPLEQFLRKIQKYDKPLGLWGGEGMIKSAVGKLRWGLGQKEEVRKLQGYLNIHVGTINILLAEHGLEKMDLISDKAASDELHVRERLEGTRTIVEKISGTLAVQTLVVENTQRMLARLAEMVGGEFRMSWKSFAEMAAKVCVCTQQTYAMLLEIKSSLGQPDIRWSFFQAPLVVEDALGYKFPVPSEYDFDILEAVVKQRFHTGPGSVDVKAGNYEYFMTKNSKEVLTRTSRLLPGTAITMAIIVVRPSLTDKTCPMPKCDSIQTVESLGGGRVCCKCNVWFSPTEKERQPLENILFAINELSDSSTTRDSYTDVKVATQRAQVAPVEQGADLFRNIRLSRNELRSELVESLGDPKPVFAIENPAGPQFDATMQSDDKTTRTLTGNISGFTRLRTYGNAIPCMWVCETCVRAPYPDTEFFEWLRPGSGPGPQPLLALSRNHKRIRKGFHVKRYYA